MTRIRLAIRRGFFYLRPRLQGKAMTPVENQRGQAMLEYVLTVILAVVPLIVFSVAFQKAIVAYLLPIYFFIGLPIP